jgi:Rrf2 family protein
VRISTKIDYALRAMAELATSADDRPVKAEHIGKSQDIPQKFLLAILNELRRSRLVRSHRGHDGGFILARPPEDITLADVMRAVEGPLANVHDSSLREISYQGSAAALTDVWKAVRASLRSVLETTTLADLASGRLPRRIQVLAEQYEEAERARR